MKRRLVTALAVLAGALGAAAPASASLTTDKYVALYNTQQECRRYTGCDTARAYVVYFAGPAGCSSWTGHFPTRYYGWRSVSIRGVGGCY